jgi:hypothetical protein
MMAGVIGELLMIAAAAVIPAETARLEGPGVDRNDPTLSPLLGPSRYAGIGGVVISPEPFHRQSAARSRSAPAGTSRTRDFWSFLPPRDAFRADALLDLRGLNEPTAGQSGFIGLSADRNDFVRGDGVPIRFWAVNFSFTHNPSLKDLAHAARFLAKRGVNLVRLHGYLESHAKNPNLFAADPKTIDQAWRLVAAMKKEGIYTSISPYWSAELKHVPASWGIEGWPQNQSPMGLLFFNPRLQAGYKAWLKALLAPRNPYTGIPLAQDPAVAMIHLQNEDSLLFWTEQNIKGEQLKLLGKQFGDWIKAKYGTIEAALHHWDGAKLPEDDPGSGVLGIHIVWQFTQPHSGGLKYRLDDQLEFLTWAMYRFNTEIGRYLRQGLGCKQLINAGNWKTANTIRLNDAERWSYTANEVVGVNGFYAPAHLGPDRGWRINNGDRFQNASVLFDPRSLPLSLKQVAGYPMIVTETLWVPPLNYQSEGPFLAAAYQSLTGLDAVYWLATGETEWSNQDRSAWDSASRFKWSIATPMILGQFPAAALLFRRGDLMLGQPAVVEHRSLEQLWQRAPPIIAEDQRYDPNRDLGDTARQLNLADGVDPLAFLVGPVKVVYGSDPAKTTVANLSRYIDHQRKVVHSNTGQIAWDYAQGLCSIDSPRSQGVTGFLKSVSPIKLGDVTIHSEDPYATVLVVSLDDKPLARTPRVLVQVGTRARPTSWADHAVTFSIDGSREMIKGRQIDDTGRMPWIIAATKITIEVRNAGLRTGTLLDINGNASRSLPVRRAEGRIELEIPKDAIYVVLSDH